MRPFSGSEPSRPTVVVDTQVWVSGLLNPSGAAAKVIAAFENGAFTLAISQPIFDEYERVLQVFTPPIEYAAVSRLLLAVLEAAVLVAPTRALPVCRDPGDDKFVECAVVARAQFLVTKNTRHYPREIEDTQVVRISRFLSAIGVSCEGNGIPRDDATAVRFSIPVAASRTPGRVLPHPRAEADGPLRLAREGAGPAAQRH
ncbi:MAG: putative toxin-antitoxin system toxin component, PIN family [Armatimonadetes bacterium]|nr:putative toxin-antitoxin system toxin component, PIN family [Armatimonadota bacterium]